MNSERTTLNRFELPNGKILRIEARDQGGKEPVSGMEDAIIKFETLMESISGLAEGLQESFSHLKPTKMAIKFGVEVSVEPGGVSALIVKGQGKGNFELSLEWEKQKLDSEIKP